MLYNRITEYQKMDFWLTCGFYSGNGKSAVQKSDKNIHVSYLGYYVNIRVSLMFGHMFMVPCFLV